ncbi:uncharacterized protein LOC124163415 [Ischnura elegans]|uniref:uncharacterized protein LOC124163415 n=1 Tax=Ischnura elegans TaxID=197161 RepID=UPI001ED8A768|nr:uncharacterized protein LOC124163415 [Ischnura elegans]
MGTATRDARTVRFIEVVRKNACLWNTDLEDYRNVAKKNEIWDSIAETFGYYDGNASKMVWKKLRDNYRDALRRQSFPRLPRGHRGLKVTKQTRNWLYQTEMEFLIPYMSNRVPENYLENLMPDKQGKQPLSQDYADSFELVEDSSSAVFGDEAQAVAEMEEPSPDLEGSSPAKEDYSEERRPKKREGLDLQGITKLKTKDLRVREKRKLIESLLRGRAETGTALDKFFQSMCQTTKEFPLKYQVEVKKVLFKVVTDIEEKLGSN